MLVTYFLFPFIFFSEELLVYSYFEINYQFKCVTNMKFRKGYLQGMTCTHRNKYSGLLKLCHGIDPYEIEKNCTSSSVEHMPKMCLADVAFYLVNRTGYFSMRDMVAYQSSETYKHIADGLLDEIFYFPVGVDKVICIAEILHPTAIDLPPFCAWVLVSKPALALTSWCTCGHNEVCCHIAALLFGIEYDCTLNFDRTN